MPSLAGIQRRMSGESVCTTSDKLDNREMKGVICEINVPVMSIEVPKIFSLCRSGVNRDRQTMLERIFAALYIRHFSYSPGARNQACVQAMWRPSCLSDFCLRDCTQVVILECMFP